MKVMNPSAPTNPSLLSSLSRSLSHGGHFPAVGLSTHCCRGIGSSNLYQL
ncbi:hypothetical protein CIPAW_15G124000 [Carya illinoinensis]|uniref:Uncharacterized protein n=1 Tax=Carya illinoinensis TaxID=32201 RepID=A0A8T1N6S5_CARIL|nr:hypothetical protein CIPAW_15G124000 [Carya illinoinensis]